ncbi:type II toxin-antitoxin system HicA family toxin [candidate division KSB1 bacterium]|nr:type II toxin-antitoxin system HicA family toxin [candidate division KSB1 bacterium]
MSSKKLVKLVKNAGAYFVRHGKGDHDIYERMVAGQRRAAPIQMGKQELRPEYSLMVFRQLGMTDQEIEAVLQ